MTPWPTLNLTAGPVDVGERTLRAMARPVLHHNDPAFVELFARTSAMLGEVFGTDHDAVVMQGEALLGLEAAAASLISPGDKVLNLVSGVYGKGYEAFIRRYGGEPIELAVPYDEAIDPEDVRRALRADPGIKFLSVVHSETPAGTVNPVAEIGPIAKEHGVVTIVDTVSGLAGEVMDAGAWGMDVAVAGPQKYLGGPPGLALLAVSPDAWAAMEGRANPLRGSYLSILDWKDTWLERRTFPYTPSVSDVYALESVLEQVLDVGVPAWAARHAAVARACRAGVRAMGLELWPAREEVAGTCVTAVKAPPGLDVDRLVDHLRARYGVLIAGSVGELRGELFRIGHMGKAAHPTALAAGLALLERALADLGHRVPAGAGVGAAMAALDGWDDAAFARADASSPLVATPA